MPHFFTVAVAVDLAHCYPMRPIKYCIYKDAPYYVAQCLNVDVSSFRETVEEAIANLKEAVELHFEDQPTSG
jgi:predicted RNase H-like HicB family nuclease